MSHKEQCPRCAKNGHDKSRNNLHVYGEGLGAFCFRCGFAILSDAEKEARGIDNWEWEEEISTKEKLTPEEVEKIKGYTGIKGKGSRGIDDSTYQAYGCRFEYDEETAEVTKHYYPVTEEYGASGYKIRKLPKDFSSVGKVGKESDLFGMWKFRNSTGKYVVLTAGEIDCMSAYQMLENYRKSRGSEYGPTPVVSSVIGETGSYKQVKLHYDWFDRFERIIVCYDNDKAGKEAVAELVKVLPKGKMYVMELSLKDTNQYLEAGREKEWIDCFFKARPYTPDGILGSSALADKIMQHVTTQKIPLPPFMHRLQDLMAGGIPLGVIMMLASASSIGKSTYVEELLFYWIYNSPYKVGIISMESDAGQYATKLLSRRIEKKIDLIPEIEEKVKLLQSPEVVAAEQDLFTDEHGNDRFYLIEDRDAGLEAMKSYIMNLIVSCDVKLIILDSWHDIVSGLTLEMQEKATTWLKGLIKSHNVTVVVVAHVRKSGNGQKAHSQGADLSEDDVMGSSTLIKSSACNLIFNRNKEAEDEIERNTTIMKMTKCRWSGQTSPYAGKFYYDNKTHKLWDFDDWAAQNTVDF